MELFKKNEKPYQVMHYEGIADIGANVPCTFLIKDEILNINFNSDLNITLPLNRIIKFEAMNENDFMMKYKNTSSMPNKNITYLVITYKTKEDVEKRIVLWAANYREIKYFIDLHYKFYIGE